MCKWVVCQRRVSEESMVGIDEALLVCVLTATLPGRTKLDSRGTQTALTLDSYDFTWFRVRISIKI